MAKNKIKVPYLDLRKSYSLIRPQLQKAFLKVIESGMVVLGKEVAEFEKEYAKFSKTKYAIGVGNGLDGLIISLSALSVGKGDEVIVPSNTYIATLIAVSRVGATPVLVEPNIDTYNIDPKLITKAINKKTKAIIPVHLFGQVCEMDEIMKIAKKNKIFVIEDNAQAHGARYSKRISGSFGDINATSFYPGKNLGAIGDAGAITTSNREYYEKSLSLRNYGERKKYFNDIIGYNSRLDELQAAFLRIKLKNINATNKQKYSIAQIYLKQLNETGDIILPKTHVNSSHAYHIFCIRTKYRNKLQKFLLEKGITTLIHYPIPSHLQKAYKHLNYKTGDFPIAEELADTSLSLPIYPQMRKKETQYVISSIEEFYAQL